VTLAEINALDRAAFVERVGWVFEHSPWIAERAWAKRPFATIDVLHGAMTRAVAEATTDEQLALLRAHPDLGTRASMSEASTGEQTSVGLTNLQPDEFERLRRLNAAYREKFGFPFLYAVKGSTKHDILKALESRLTSDHRQECAEALRQADRIARFRLEELIT
jgi:2-oxo-4-hydroxy-4-carboxy-5-ureidoimidazoline decarboxylase